MRGGRFVSRVLAETTSIARSGRPAKPGLRIVTYHSVGNRALADTEGVFSVSPGRFSQHVGLFGELGCSVGLKPVQLPTNRLCVSVTFDDGYRDNLRIAAPILLDHNVPFTVFVSSDYVQTRAPGFLTPEELKELASLRSVRIGAHGRSHRPLTTCSDAELDDELYGSKHYLEQLIGHPVTALAYPFGAADLRVRDAALRLGYEVGLCTRFDINRPGRDPLLLCRCSIERDDTLRVLRQKLYGAWDWYRWRTPDPLTLNGATST